MSELESIAAFKAWLLENGAAIHPAVTFQPVPSGFDVVAGSHVLADATIVSIPFALAITPVVSKKALADLFRGRNDTLDGWSERQLECTYVCMHWIADRASTRDILKHAPYIDTLPTSDKLRTPLHFTDTELQAFQGSNLHGATLDRRQTWEAEWQECKVVVDAANAAWGGGFTWEKYLTASTYLSSRAFPSTLLSPTPSLIATRLSHPVLLPGIDSLNHARAHPVSWVVSSPIADGSTQQHISLVIHTPTPRGAELLNNYGPKPNSELILGYGFSLPNNPDDTIVLKMGGAPSAAAHPASASSVPAPANEVNRWEVGRSARGAEPVWEAVLAANVARAAASAQDGDDEDDTPASDAENQLFAAQTLAEMAEHLHDRLPPFPPVRAAEMRPEVVQMLEHYLEGQRDILRALVEFAQEKEARALEALRELGLDIVDEEDEEEEDA
ncbi:SET domain-containing protein [Fomes fomentarius]|nr:SET domain-containing protein [Fomes fomentarius]